MLNANWDHIKRNAKKVKRDPKLFFIDVTKKRVPQLLSFVQPLAKSQATPSQATPSQATPSQATLSQATLSQATPSQATPSQATPSRIPEETLLTYYNNQLYEFSKRYAVNSLRIGDEYIWPYLRNHILVNLYATWRGRTAFKQMNPLALSTAHFSKFSNDIRVYSKVSIGAKDYDDLENEKCDFLFVVPHSGFGRVEIDEQIYHRLIDPIYEVAVQVGKARKIEFLANPNMDFIDSWHKYKYKTISVLPPKFQKTGYFQDLKYRDDFFINYKGLFKTQTAINRHILNTVVDNEIFSREWYKDVLQQIEPSVIFLSLFHYNAPIISAADELGILTVDIQHGLQVGDGVLYNHHEEIPAIGYQAYPDYFAVWGDKEFNGIKKSFQGSKHKPILMGNPWLNKLESFADNFSDKFHKLISKEKRLIGLIILKDQETIQDIYKEVIEATKENVFWLVRHHPTARKYFSTRDFISGFINNQVMVADELDKGNICKLLQHVDLTLSEGSALAYEASHYGVKNFVFSDYAADNFALEIKQGGFYLVEDADGFIKKFEALDFTNKVNVIKPFSDVDLTVFLDELTKASSTIIRKTDPLKAKDLMVIKTFVDKVDEIKVTMDDNANLGYILRSVKNYYELRQVLSSAPYVENLYQGEQDYFIKESRIFQKKLRQNFGLETYDVFMVSDSLGLPRPHETAKPDFSIMKTTAGQFNADLSNQANGHAMMVWAQRYLTTEKLLDNWDEIVGDIQDKHFIVHLGLNDSSERIFQERERLALDLLDPTVKREIVDFGKKYRREIIQNQFEFNYVSVAQFRKNLYQIVQMAKKQGAKSISFVNILYFPKSHEINTPRSISNTKKYNDIIVDVVSELDDVFLIDLEDKFCIEGKESCLLEDNMHLSPKGHQVFAKHIASLIQRTVSANYNIAIIGVGQLGSRYLQGLRKLELGDTSVNIQLVENYESSQQVAVERYGEVSYLGSTKKQIKFVNSVDGLSNWLDLVIIATGADVRASLLRQLIDTKTFKNLILEKVLFQEISDYRHFKTEFSKLDTRVWVNHPRREFEYYKSLVADIAKSDWIDFSVSGTNWGMACNGLHFLDLIQFLQNDSNLTSEDVTIQATAEKVIDSKRAGHYEVYGQISGRIGKANFSLSCRESRDNVVAVTMTINTDSMRMAIDEINGQVNVSYAEDDWQWHSESVDIVEYQSGLTKKVVENILLNGHCHLPNYDDARLLHEPFIETMLTVLNESSGDNTNEICRIT